MSIKITGTGSYIPDVKVSNADFHQHEFYTTEGVYLDRPPEEITRKFEEITGIRERRYATSEQNTSTLAYEAGQRAIEDAGCSPEEIDGIFVAHNFGDVAVGQHLPDLLPSMATRVKHSLGIQNPDCIAFDLLYGCPGWIQTVITAHHYLKADAGKRYLVVGAETLSRNIDPYDRDGMIFADGAGACILERVEDGKTDTGVLSTVSQTFTQEEAFYLHHGMTYHPESSSPDRYVKMNGRRIFEFGLSHVPAAMKKALEKAQVPVEDLHKVLIHQANEKMDEGIIKRFYKQYRQPVPENIMPMSIHELGNSSVATVPTLLDRMLHGQMDGHTAQAGDVILMTSVGSGMALNALVYRL